MKIINTEWIKEALIADLTMNSVEGHNIQRMARIQKIIPNNTLWTLDLHIQSHLRWWINRQGGHNCCPRSTETLSPWKTYRLLRRNKMQPICKGIYILARDKPEHQEHGKSMQQISTSTSQTTTGAAIFLHTPLGYNRYGHQWARLM